MTVPSDVRQQVLHALRVLGYAGTLAVSERLGRPVSMVEEALLDAQAAAQVTWTRFADEGGWSLTEIGRADGERFLAVELERTGARSVVESVMTEFEPLNRRVTDACTQWQLTEIGASETRTDLEETVDRLERAGRAWALLEERLVRELPRFRGYYARYMAALARALSDPAWLTGVGRDSVHRVWFELHEDLLATLGISR